MRFIIDTEIKKVKRSFCVVREYLYIYIYI